MSEKCPAGNINCEHYKQIDANEVVGKCFANRKMDIARNILNQDTQCPCPKLQKKIKSKNEKTFDIFEKLWDNSESANEILFDVNRCARAQFYQALIEGGYENN